VWYRPLGQGHLKGADDFQFMLTETLFIVVGHARTHTTPGEGVHPIEHKVQHVRRAGKARIHSGLPQGSATAHLFHVPVPVDVLRVEGVGDDEGGGEGGPVDGGNGDSGEVGSGFHTHIMTYCHPEYNPLTLMHFS